MEVDSEEFLIFGGYFYIEAGLKAIPSVKMRSVDIDVERLSKGNGLSLGCYNVDVSEKRWLAEIECQWAAGAIF